VLHRPVVSGILGILSRFLLRFEANLSHVPSSGKWGAYSTCTKKRTKAIFMYYRPDFLTGINSEVNWI